MADALLRRVERDPQFAWPDPPVFPFTLPAFAGFQALELHPEVTFLVGENGSGKSTLLEAIAAKLDLDVEGSDRDVRFEDREADIPDGLFLLDEPEAALSPTGLLGLLRRMKSLTLEGSQFLVATHSPILLAYPDALIYELRAEGPVPTPYEDTDHYRLTRAFLNAPDRFLRELLS